MPSVVKTPLRKNPRSMSHLSDSIKGFFLVGWGSAGGIVAVLKPWQENIESGLRIVLLLLSIISVIVGLVIATKPKPPAK